MSDQEQVDATSTEDEQVTETEQQETTSTEGESALGDAGKKALDAMKAERAAARADAKAAKEELDRIKAELALKDKSAEEQELERARAEARAEATKLANQRILRSELKALATGKLADPTDAALYINLDDFTVTDDGDVETDALTDAISALLEKKPHLAAPKQNRFDGDADQGAKKATSKPPQLTREQLAGMSPQEIVAAQNAGQLEQLGFKPNP